MAEEITQKTEIKSFVLYNDTKELWESLSDEQAGKLIKHIYDYVSGAGSNSPDEMTKLLSIQIKKTIDRDQKKWKAVRKTRSEIGKMGGRPTKAKKAIGLSKKQNKAIGFSEKQNEAKKAVSVNDNANTTVNRNKDEDEELHDIDFLFQKYLGDETLVKAGKEFIKGLDLKQRLTEFNLSLKAKNITKKAWKDYPSHFYNWHNKAKIPEIPNSPTFNSPVI